MLCTERQQEREFYEDMPDLLEHRINQRTVSKAMLRPLFLPTSVDCLSSAFKKRSKPLRNFREMQPSTVLPSAGLLPMWIVGTQRCASRLISSCPTLLLMTMAFLVILDIPWHKSTLESEAPRMLHTGWEASRKRPILRKILSVNMALPTAYSLIMPRLQLESKFMTPSDSIVSKISDLSWNTNIKTLLNARSAMSNGSPAQQHGPHWYSCCFLVTLPFLCHLSIEPA